MPVSASPRATIAVADAITDRSSVLPRFGDGAARSSTRVTSREPRDMDSAIDNRIALPPMTTISIDRLGERIRASVAGSLAAEAAVGLPSGALHMLAVAESLADRGDFDGDDLRARGLGSMPACGSGGVLVRVVPYGLVLPADRPHLRRCAYRAALLASADEGTAAIAVATAVLATDLLRFDLDTALVRVRQTLLEEVPMPVQQRLAPLLPAEAQDPGDDPGASLQLAITVLSTTTGVIGAIDAVIAAAPQAAVAASLAGALAGCRDGLEGITSSWLEAIPAAEPARRASERLAERATERLASGRVTSFTATPG
jgi:hypothetical protein